MCCAYTYGASGIDLYGESVSCYSLQLLVASQTIQTLTLIDARNLIFTYKYDCLEVRVDFKN